MDFEAIVKAYPSICTLDDSFVNYGLDKDGNKVSIVQSNVDTARVTLDAEYQALDYARKRAAETTGGRAIYEMVYLNVAIPDGLSLFDRTEIEACRDQKRDIGQVPAGVRLIAGLDPASTGYQAAVLWGYNTETGVLYLIDLHNNLGGGIPQALEVIKDWWQKYTCSHWVIEENGFQKAIRQDESIRVFAATHGIFLEGHETRNQKFDPL